MALEFANLIELLVKCSKRQMKQEIQECYMNMVGAMSASMVDRFVWYMTHKISKAPKFFKSLCEAPQDALQ